MALLKDVVEKIRSKNAGPFWLTIDIFCGPTHSIDEISALLPNNLVAGIFEVDPSAILRFEQPDIGTIKFSLSRPAVQGTSTDRDMHGASFAILLEELEVAI